MSEIAGRVSRDRTPLPLFQGHQRQRRAEQHSPGGDDGVFRAPALCSNGESPRDFECVVVSKRRKSFFEGPGASTSLSKVV